MLLNTINPDRFQRGDIIKIKSIWTHIACYPIWHYGVVVGYDDIVHFNLDVSELDIQIIRTNLRQFVGLGTDLQKAGISNCHAVFELEEIAKRAEAQVGTRFGGYDLINNNCEHFANWCATGEKFSNQIFIMAEEEHTIADKVKEEFIYEPILNIADKNIEFCENAQIITDRILEGIINFCDILDL